MADIVFKASSQTFGQLFALWDQILSYSQSITPDTTTIYDSEENVISAYFNAFSSFDAQVSDGDLVSENLSNGASSGTIKTPSWTMQLTGSISSSGSTITKEAITASNGNVLVVANGIFKYSGLPVVSTELAGGQLNSVTSSVPDPLSSSDSVLDSITAQTNFNGSTYSGIVVGYADGLYDRGDQEYYTQNLSVDQSIIITNSSYYLSDGTLNAENDDVLNSSSAVTDSVSVNGLDLDLNQLDVNNYFPQLVAGVDVVSISGGGALVNAENLFPKLISQDSEMTSLDITASAATIQNNLASLETISQQGKLGSINLTDGGTPTITATAAQLSADSSVFDRIQTQYVVACFAGGSHLATERGEIMVQHLRYGDLVRLAEGGTAPVVWIGHRRVACRSHRRPCDVQPVRIAAHAFGVGRPHRDLLLSPDHAVFVDGVLIPIRYLLNDATVRQEYVDNVTYWHVELPSHGVLLAEGLPVESYLDTGNRSAFVNGGNVVMAHADFASGVWQRKGCASLVTEGTVRDVVYRRLLAQAFALGWKVCDAGQGASSWLPPKSELQASARAS